MYSTDLKRHSELDLHFLRAEVIKIAKKAGDFIAKELEEFDQRVVEVKDFNSLVSYVDIEAEKMIVKDLKLLLPSAGFVLEEESVEQDKSSILKWIVDPLDGTTNFIHALPFFSVSIALKNGNNYMLGVVYDVMHNDMYSATDSNGAFLNDCLIKVSEEENLSECVLATGFPYRVYDQMDAYLDLFKVLFQKTRGIRRFGSAALDLCYVAKGSFGGFFELGLSEWDIAAGICIVNEAGGKVTDFYGKEQIISDESLLATNARIHEDLQIHIERSFRSS